MASMYPQELRDVEATSDCIRNTVADWTRGGLNDKQMAVLMNGHCGLLGKDIMFLKERCGREAKIVLELTGEEVST